MMEKIYRISPLDNVAVALENLKTGETVGSGKDRFPVLEPVQAGHKIALRDIGKGEAVLKYGFPIGTASSRIPRGAWVHTQNVKTRLSGLLKYTYRPSAPPVSADF